MTTTLTEQTTRWRVEPDDSCVDFAVRTFWGMTTARGRFDRFEGVYEIGPDETTIALVIDGHSLDTGNTKRDEHLRSDDFFDLEEHPLVRFLSTRVHHVNDEYLHVVGHLEAAGKRVFLEFPAHVRVLDDQLEIEATTTVDQQELGMSSGVLGMIRRPATLHVRARLTRS